jgi:PAS domain S-box-containing protein
MTEIFSISIPEAIGEGGNAQSPVAPSTETYFRALLDELPAAIYVTDAQGRIIYYNEAAATLWGHRPPLGRSEWCGSWKLFWPDGSALPHGECPMAVAIKEQRIVRGMDAIAERPDGTRIPFMPYPTPLFDGSGNLIGAVNMLIDISDRIQAQRTKQWLAAIVQFSDDAIISKNLDGVIESWNAGAERVFGYTARETIGQPVLMLIPPDRQNEEAEILNCLRRGERVDHYETVRRRKDGTLIDVSLTVSPIFDDTGRVIGASKIARDITERRKAQEQRQVLFREMDHRIRNLFTLASSVVSLSAPSARTPAEMAAIARDRLEALARAHALTVPRDSAGLNAIGNATTLHTLIHVIIAPYEEIGDGQTRIVVSGPDVPIGARLATDFALVLHELATNAAKYGALSTPTGRVHITCAEANDVFSLTWTERGGPRIESKPTSSGFGSQLAKATIINRLNGELSHEWSPDGLTVRLSVERSRLAG